ncbi:MAG: hypothetical protein Q4D33_04980 [Prevotellaceae bacterium]|nr:hypothetical protein [Prevotellaceae bacterium]
MKLNPILEKKILGFSLNEILGLLCALATADIAVTSFNITNNWLKYGLWIVMLIVGLFLYTIVIALIKTYITKED